MKRGAYIGGTFDLFHAGHIRLLEAAHKQYKHVTVALNGDSFVARYKLRTPFIQLGDRIEVLRACRFVNQVLINYGDEDSKPCILRSNAEYIVHGDDWTGEAYMRQLGVTQSWLDAQGIKIVYLPYTAGISTTEIAERVAKCWKPS